MYETIFVWLSIVLWVNDGTSEPYPITCTDPNEVGDVCGCESQCINGFIGSNDCLNKTCIESCKCKTGYYRAGNNKCISEYECWTGGKCNDISCDCGCQLDSNNEPQCINKWEPRGLLLPHNDFNEYTKTCQLPKSCSISNPCPLNTACVIKDYLNNECFEGITQPSFNQSICVNITDTSCLYDWNCNSDEVCYDLTNDNCNDVCLTGPIGPGSCLKQCVKVIPQNYCDDGYIYDSSLNECIPKTCSDSRKIYQNCPICENQCRPPFPPGIYTCYDDDNCNKRCVCDSGYYAWEGKCVTQTECEILKQIYSYQYNMVSAKDSTVNNHMDRPHSMWFINNEQKWKYWSIGIIIMVILSVFAVIFIGYYACSKDRKPKEYKFNSVVNEDVDTTAQ